MKVGDVVRLKSGSPTMVIEKLTKHGADVIWHYEGIRRERIPIELLDVVDVEKEISKAEDLVRSAFQQSALGHMDFRGPGN